MIVKCVCAATCGGCLYYRQMRNSKSVEAVYACHYCYDTGKPRGCSIVGCVRKRVVSAKQRKKLIVSKFNPDMVTRR